MICNEMRTTYKENKAKVFGIIEMGVRDECEDTSICCDYEKGTLIGVFDGHGGCDVSDFCCQNIVKALDVYKDLKWEERLRKAVLYIQNDLRKTKISAQGTTATITYIDKDKNIFVATLGDTKAMLINNKGEIIKCDEKNGVNIMIDHMDKEFGEHKIENTNKDEKFITVSHNYMGKNTCEYEYYTRVFGKKFIEKHGTHYMVISSSVFSMIQPLRVLGNITTKILINEPVVYSWRLADELKKNSSLIVMSDGLENHLAFTPEKIGAFLNNPINYLKDFDHMLGGTFIEKYDFIKPHNLPHDKKTICDTKENRLVKTMICANFKEIVDKLCSVLKNDIKWVKKLHDAFEKFKSVFADFQENYNITTEPKKTLRLITLVAVLLGSDDNITIMSKNFEK